MKLWTEYLARVNDLVAFTDSKIKQDDKHIIQEQQVRCVFWHVEEFGRNSAETGRDTFDVEKTQVYTPL